MLTTELLQSYSGTTVQGNHFIHSCQTKNIELDFLEKYLKKMNDAPVTGSVVSKIKDGVNSCVYFASYNRVFHGCSYISTGEGGAQLNSVCTDDPFFRFQ